MNHDYNYLISGSVTAPRAGQSIVTLFAGDYTLSSYKVTIEYGYYTTASILGINLGAAEKESGGNIAALLGNNPVGNIDGRLNAPPQAGILNRKSFTMFLDGTENISVVAVENGTSGVIYCASILLDITL